MKTFSFFCLSSCLITAAMAQSPVVPSPDVQIKTAVLAAPADKRDGAAVYGYSAKNEFVLLRKGSNELVCLADDPAQKGLSVSCYHRDLDPFMDRGRVLKQEGKKANEILAIREKEVKAKTLKMPEQPSTLFVYTAKDGDYNPTSGDVKDGYLRYVVYIPYATAESTGLPTKPEAPGMPWIMDPGTHRAHIMINPPVSTTAHH
ncbi:MULTISPECIES: hypothetical protein [Spirosoma]|uniref:Uncharacterized protein n=1 Tax=Spirosoma liriopis TaxID=2937440 RepID=A0ABT0HGE7_9BACT|nr:MULTISPECIES: hypothetical protein [Spirosoma]MCK8491231.1 hypothetical protein [Spirosoma liriopis]UHG90608.1 hypothetical protein LQ777_20450 [Spirosoma oryzicola]